jgi:hypothetical protein
MTKETDYGKLLQAMYDQGFADCEAAAKLAIEHGIKHAILAEREACAKLVEGGNHVHPKAPDAIWAKTVAKLVRARGNHEQV